MQKEDFESFFQANERRIHYQIHQLNIRGNWYGEFYAEGIFAIWQAYRDFDSTKGNHGTYINYRIRHRLLDLIRKKQHDQQNDEKVIEQSLINETNGNRIRHSDIPLLTNLCLQHTDVQF